MPELLHFFQFYQIPKEFFAQKKMIYPQFHKIQLTQHRRLILSFRMCDRDTSTIQILAHCYRCKPLDFYRNPILSHNQMFFFQMQSKKQLVPRQKSVLMQFHVHGVLLELSLKNFSFYRKVPHNPPEECEALGYYWTI